MMVSLSAFEHRAADRSRSIGTAAPALASDATLASLAAAERGRKALFGKSRNIFRESSEESPEWKREKGGERGDGMVVESGFEEMETNITLLAAESGGDTDLE